jgi:hypothetical protein
VPFLHPQPEDASCRGSREPFSMGDCFIFVLLAPTNALYSPSSVSSPFNITITLLWTKSVYHSVQFSLLQCNLQVRL